MNRPQSRSIHSKRSANTDLRGSADMARSAKQRYDHYIALAREKALAGDCIEAENYYQHAEHYFRSAAALAPSAQKVDQPQ
ncbi:DUF4167 domain-containing protein (plasmid) [Rhizobium lusitanum]|uniref:DUF4167 domain-containing protein n=1 Tax=Rhizobium lusitanum TaxID=293958 RepID=UPI00161D7682|nr:DUF4167 domain-containing protein [Rhizobium lusitanum]